MQISIKIENLAEVQAAIRETGKQARFAAARALTETAESARQRAVQRMAQVFQAPTDYTLRSLFKRPATKERLESMVYVKDAALTQKSGGRGPARVLGHLFGGGAREDKNFELILRRRGLLPNGLSAVPGAGVVLDANGNMPRGLVVQLLAYFSAFDEQGYQANMTIKSRKRFERRLSAGAGARVQFFISRGRGNWFGARSWLQGRLQHLPPGIWMRSGNGADSRLRPIVMFVRRPKYRQYLSLPEIVQDTVSAEFPARFRRAYSDALATAR